MNLISLLLLGPHNDLTINETELFSIFTKGLTLNEQLAWLHIFKNMFPLTNWFKQRQYLIERLRVCEELDILGSFAKIDKNYLSRKPVIINEKKTISEYAKKEASDWLAQR